MASFLPTTTMFVPPLFYSTALIAPSKPLPPIFSLVESYSSGCMRVSCAKLAYGISDIFWVPSDVPDGLNSVHKILLEIFKASTAHQMRRRGPFSVTSTPELGTTKYTTDVEFTFCSNLLKIFGRNSRTRAPFKPKSAGRGTSSWQLKQFAEATLGSGSLRKAVKLPEGEDLNEWLAVNGKLDFTKFGCL
jgi:hypothetical protein